MAYLIDTHCHLNFPEIYKELGAVLARAEAAGVKKLITIGVKLAEADTLIDITEQYKNVFCAIGTHPSNVEEAVTLERLVAYAQHEKVVALGETGLDYHYSGELAELQKQAFRTHIQAARLTDLPVVIHTRNADEDMRNILDEEAKIAPFKFVLHCYSSGAELAQFALSIGGYISFSGIVSFKNAAEIRSIASSVPRSRLLVETDAPYLAPVPYRGRSNEPAFIVETAKSLAQTLEMSYEDVLLQTTQNALRLFSKIPQ